MTAPRTLPALRAAVARVLVARGEAADALRVKRGPYHGLQTGVAYSAWPMLGAHPHPLEVYVARDDGDEGAAIAEAWSMIVARLSDEYDHADDAAHAAQGVCDRIAAALAVAREIGGTDG